MAFDLDDEELKATRRMNGSDKNVGSMEEDIEKVENLIKKCDECKLNECINCEISWTEIASVRRLIDNYKKLEKNSISVSLVEEKIEELKNAKKSIDKENWKYIYQMQINILQELLEKRK